MIKQDASHQHLEADRQRAAEADAAGGGSGNDHAPGGGFMATLGRCGATQTVN